MPLYRFLCKECGKEESLLLKYNQEPPRCKNCNGELEKQISKIASSCKGSGSCSGCSGSNCSSCG